MTIPTPKKAFIAGLAGLEVSPDERAFFHSERPWGFILFSRNCETAEQIKDLVQDLKELGGSESVPVFIDQEGGRVQRLRPPLAPSYPPGAAYGALYERNPEAGLEAVWLGGRLIACDLAKLGINADCLPVLDIPVEGAHDVIGDRAYGTDPDIVSILARKAGEGLLAGGILPVIKHIPGHGRAGADSHLELPRVSTSLEELRKTDLAPFSSLRDFPMAMTAHVVYEAIDPKRPASTSDTVIGNIIRTDIGFDGLLMSDDVSMNALHGEIGERSRACFAAGCDIVLHCNGKMHEMQAVADVAPVLEGRALERANETLGCLKAPDPFNEADARHRFENLFS
ncbi:MAG: beta-N-acetylhexosaminidase [Pseudomonadota bacterium]